MLVPSFYSFGVSYTNEITGGGGGVCRAYKVFIGTILLNLLYNTSSPFSETNLKLGKGS